MSGAQTSLYQRLGGYDALAVVVDDRLPRLQGDPQLGVYWKGQNTHTKKRGRQLLLDFLVLRSCSLRRGLLSRPASAPS